MAVNGSQQPIPICPFTLTTPEPKSAIVGVQADERPVGRSCVLRACAFFVAQADEQGRIVGGSCAVAVLAFAVSQNLGLIANVAVAQHNAAQPAPGSQPVA